MSQKLRILIAFVFAIFCLCNQANAGHTYTAQDACSQKYGCKSGSCWKGCAGALGGSNSVYWCYITDPSKVNKPRSCSKDDDCRMYTCNNCHGGCTL